jgi:hypothetical protein
MSNLNINQFQQVTVRGTLDLQISKDGVLTGQISVNQATDLNPGDFVKLDTANTGPVPQFVAADDDDTGIGAIIYDVKQSTLSAGVACQVAFLGGPVMWLEAGATISPGDAVEDNGSGQVITKAAHAQKGIALDPGVTGELLRVILTSPIVA